MPLQKFDTNFRTLIRLRLILWRVLLQRLLKTLDSELPQRLLQQLGNGKLIITLRRHLVVTQPFHVAHQSVD